MKDSKSKRIGFVGTLLFHTGIVALLFFLGFRTPLPFPEEEGILINFGNTDQGAGNKRPAPTQSPAAQKSKPKPVIEKKEAVKQIKKTASSPKEKILTQNTEDAPALLSAEEIAKRKAKKEKAIKLKQEQDKARKIEAEKKRIVEQKRLEDEKAEQERLAEIERENLAEIARQEKITSINNKTKNAFGSGTSNANSQGKTFPSGNQGKINGSPDSNNYTGSGLGNKGNSFDLKGRNSISIPKPQYNLQESGKVVVEVTVDRNGKVTNARPGVSGSTTANLTLFEAAKRAALKAKFNSDSKAPAHQRGTITYHFQLD
ncbi:TonB family protein [Ancylomarina euxinus]|uniref:TonB family protein n=1 Tax=Ancylomarina euxinus TaxID=2283627 RepID=A0A425Y5R5_9BACT|nr:cell envelope integrity protein TolA [Ancylomarina euxinus]MCZ4694185.1 cell envelope integrity protein TolA [Ancylomarina euxinus]MUP14484.1 TonB family protein [Ancylomarina euxinus]RRG23785.1 TonB family protein [Ancylomarina euxinus]